jgi:hypothetical protein
LTARGAPRTATTARKICCSDSPQNGGTPHSRMYRITPALQLSTSWPYDRFSTCGGNALPVNESSTLWRNAAPSRCENSPKRTHHTCKHSDHRSGNLNSLPPKIVYFPCGKHHRPAKSSRGHRSNHGLLLEHHPSDHTQLSGEDTSVTSFPYPSLKGGVFAPRAPRSKRCPPGL